MIDDIKNTIWHRSDAWLSESLPDMIAMRRDLHMHPEPAGEEVRTSSLVLERMQDAGLTTRTEVSATGLIVDIDLADDPAAPRLAIRADMDCVQVADEKDVPWASVNDGCCHACGHDAHTTMACYAAHALSREANAIRSGGAKSNLRFIFQPAEESATGALDMIDRGALEGVDQIIALHVEPFLDTGRLGIRTGPITANLMSFKVTLLGRGGHSARPHEAVDPIPAAINLVSLLYQLGPRSVDSRRAHCVTVTSVRGGETINAIPDAAEVCGTIRAARVEEAQTLRRMVIQCVEAACLATGCESDVTFPHEAPATNNDPHVVEMMAAVAREVVGAECVVRLELPSLGGEDFALYQQQVPGAMARLGTGNGPMTERHPLHSGLFDIEETALLVGSRLLTRTALHSVL
ncbi:MAG: amidohydrolase [Phycisphaerae bacterium]|nr:amidohydrolase [Phycisphaerae bacterium]